MFAISHVFIVPLFLTKLLITQSQMPFHPFVIDRILHYFFMAVSLKQATQYYLRLWRCDKS